MLGDSFLLGKIEGETCKIYARNYVTKSILKFKVLVKDHCPPNMKQKDSGRRII